MFSFLYRVRIMKTSRDRCLKYSVLSRIQDTKHHCFARYSHPLQYPCTGKISLVCEEVWGWAPISSMFNCLLVACPDCTKNREVRPPNQVKTIQVLKIWKWQSKLSDLVPTVKIVSPHLTSDVLQRDLLQIKPRNPRSALILPISPTSETSLYLSFEGDGNWHEARDPGDPRVVAVQYLHRRLIRNPQSLLHPDPTPLPFDADAAVSAFPWLRWPSSKSSASSHSSDEESATSRPVLCRTNTSRSELTWVPPYQFCFVSLDPVYNLEWFVCSCEGLHKILSIFNAKLVQ
jgi:hypothetical protein